MPLHTLKSDPARCRWTASRSGDTSDACRHAPWAITDLAPLAHRLALVLTAERHQHVDRALATVAAVDRAALPTVLITATSPKATSSSGQTGR
jgi:hypothetical protein